MAQEDISFTIPAAERAVVNKIAKRARDLEIKYAEPGQRPRTLLDWQMDIIATYANGNRLDLAKLFNFDDFNFGHDVFGICRHLDREMGKLTGFFSPRSSAREHADAA